MIFRDRFEAGLLLAEKIEEGDIVLGIPRGGVVVAAPIATKLDSPLSVIVSVKLRAPWNPELGIGALSEAAEYLNEDLISALGITEEYLNAERERARRKVEEYVRKFRKGQPLGVKGKTVVLVDDGLATGATFFAAAKSLRKMGAEKIVGAVPVLPRELVEKAQKFVDLLVFLHAPLYFEAVGQFYRDFTQISDTQVLEILKIS